MQIDWRFEVAKSFILRLSISPLLDPKLRKKAGELYSWLELYKIKKMEENKHGVTIPF